MTTTPPRFDLRPPQSAWPLQRIVQATFAVVALVGCLAVSGCANSSDESPTVLPYRSEVPVVDDPHPVPEGQRCPPTVNDGPVALEPTRRGPLVAPGATSAVLCSYALPKTGSTRSLDSAREVPNPEAIIEEVNGMPDAAPRGDPAPGETPVKACPMMATRGYRLELFYPNRVPAAITADLNCGVLTHAGAVRYPTNLQQLLDSWAR